NDAFARKTCAARSLGSSLLSNWSAEGAPSVPGLASFRPNHFIGLYERELELAAAACAAPAPAGPCAAAPPETQKTAKLATAIPLNRTLFMRAPRLRVLAVPCVTLLQVKESG